MNDCFYRFFLTYFHHGKRKVLQGLNVIQQTIFSPGKFTKPVFVQTSRKNFATTKQNVFFSKKVFHTFIQERVWE